MGREDRELKLRDELLERRRVLVERRAKLASVVGRELAALPVSEARRLGRWYAKLGARIQRLDERLG